MRKKMMFEENLKITAWMQCRNAQENVAQRKHNKNRQLDAVVGLTTIGRKARHLTLLQ
jgi:hypothetical protein